MSNILKNVFYHATMDCHNLSPVGKFVFGFADFDMSKQVSDQILDMIESSGAFGSLEGFDRSQTSNFQLTSFNPIQDPGVAAELARQVAINRVLGNKPIAEAEATDREEITASTVEGAAMFDYIKANAKCDLQMKVAIDIFAVLCWVVDHGGNLGNLQYHVDDLASKLYYFRHQIGDAIAVDEAASNV